MHAVALAENKAFSDGLINRHPNLSHLLRSLYGRWVKRQGVRFANTNLRRVSESLTADGLPLSAAMHDESIKNQAIAEAKVCDGLAHRGDGELEAIVEKVKNRVEVMGVEWPVDIKKKDTAEIIRGKNLAAIDRACSDKWWRGRLRKKYRRQVEGVLRGEAFVRKGRSPYVSNFALERFKEAKARNRSILEGLELECDQTGEVLGMAAAVDASVSNPENMRNELMVRMRGWEEVSVALGLQGVFFTLTTPSKYHAVNHRGYKNSKYNGSDPLEALKYLNGVWSRIRSEWARNGIRSIGFRVAEPHGDGTPHFHFLLFFSPCEIETAKEVFGRHALAVDGDEPGAKKYRWDAQDIDPSRGSAAAYIAKYVAKNVDGEAVGWDYEGNCTAEEGALRVKAWASIWGVRQFQQIGNASVTVWRELRRRREPLEDWEPQEAEEIRHAADSQDWAKFVELMGGAFARRDKSSVQVNAEKVLENPEAALGKRAIKKINTARRKMRSMKTQRGFKRWADRVSEIREEEVRKVRRKAEIEVALYDSDRVVRLRALQVQKPEPNSYGEYVNKLIGLVMRGAARAMKVIVTRDKAWRVQESGTAERRDIQAGASPPPLDLCQ